MGLAPGFDLESPATLGLKIVRNLIEQIHGRIGVALERGTDFQVLFAAGKMENMPSAD